MDRLVFLFGAGASAGSGDVVPSQPPLGTQLASAIYGLGGEFSELANFAFGGDFTVPFESAMAEMLRFREHVVWTMHRAAAKVLLNYTPGPRNVYGRVVEHFGRRRVTYTSLNYDLLLELSMIRLGIAPYYGPVLGSLTQHAARAEVVKPHGSANFWDATNRFINCNIQGGVRLDGTIKALAREEAIRRVGDPNVPMPCMSIYAEGKDVHFGRDTIDDQQTAFAAATQRASNIFIIGTRVVAGDNHIWGPIAASSARVTYFAHSSDDEAEFARWSANRARVECIRCNFSEAADYLIQRFRR